ncbi:hypothetical protein BHE74_00041982 [Ensete ventricosum]|nr:hypothetical protein BHE74_00041982 [Ensete ventricosum]
MLRSEAAIGFGRALARKFCSNSLVSWSKEVMVVYWRWSYHIRAGPLRVLAGIGLSRISGVKGDLCLELFVNSSFDLMTSFWTSSRRSFTRRSCTQNELVESDDRVSWSCWGCSIPRWGAADFSGTIDGVSGGLGSIGPGRASVGGSRDPSWLVGARWGSDRGGGWGCYCLSELRDIGDDCLYYPSQGLYLMRKTEESFRGDYLRRMNGGSEPRISEQPPIPIGSQGGLSPVRGTRLGNRKCRSDLGHGRRDGSRGSHLLVHRAGDQITSMDLVTWQLRSFLRAASFGDIPRSCRRPEPSCLDSAESLRRSRPDKSSIAYRQAAAPALTRCLSPTARGTVPGSTTTPALVRRLLPTTRE